MIAGFLLSSAITPEIPLLSKDKRSLLFTNMQDLVLNIHLTNRDIQARSRDDMPMPPLLIILLLLIIMMIISEKKNN